MASSTYQVERPAAAFAARAMSRGSGAADAGFFATTWGSNPSIVPMTAKKRHDLTHPRPEEAVSP